MAALVATSCSGGGEMGAGGGVGCGGSRFTLLIIP